MITCPSCNHQNPEGSLQCENCYTPLPASTSCPNCGTSVQTDATFCGQCGFNLQAENPLTEAAIEEKVDETAIGSLPDIPLDDFTPPGVLPEISVAEAESDILPETTMSSPIANPWEQEEEEDKTIGQPRASTNLESTDIAPTGSPDLELPQELELPNLDETNNDPWSSESTEPDLDLDTVGVDNEVEVQPDDLEATNEFVESPAVNNPPVETTEQKPPVAGNISGMTQLQVTTASLLHLQSDTAIEIPANLDVVHIGKPNNQIPPDIDVAGFPDSEVVSRIHADIRIEGDIYYIEDVGSSNGTYINHTPLVKGNRHRLRVGDRIALGKGDLVTFIFQLD